MADDEQFSLCWNNFNSNLSAGFHESLCRGDLVDVTLAAEGQFVKAHRLVLSVCSPYFRRMFTQMPANQHAFVFLKDVSHTALKDLIQFMYCGEVNVKQDALPAFISTAEALQIKGLTDSEPAPSQSPAKPSTPAPQPQPQTITTPTMTTATTTTSPRARTSNQRSRYKLESEDSGDENKPTNQLVLQQTQTTQQHQQATLVQQTQKRPAQRSITPHTAPTVKRIKNNDPLEGTDATTTTTQITVQAVTDSKSATGEPEYIDLPIDLPTKSEPDYGEEAADVEAAEQEATYVEDDSYGDMKYDESYFTENEEGGGTTTGATTSTAAVKQSVSFSDSYVSDTGEQQQAATEAQGKSIDKNLIRKAGRCGLDYEGYRYYKCSVKKNGVNYIYYRCSKSRSPIRCFASLQIIRGILRVKNKEHNHPPGRTADGFVAPRPRIHINRKIFEHKLVKCTEKVNNRLKRLRCAHCYAEMKATHGSAHARKYSRTVPTMCMQCEGAPFLCSRHFKKLH
ncbi:modifier of mdg4 isoform X4 [Hermetia illucens]|uniref:modifier of mdg4 isoform X4 n=1 Tax=Hermetia illucens TaxID=343691 RepID=UPI0018CC35D5|nr:modifier of mdg4 isoform X4 [Hermetia illucens]